MSISDKFFIGVPKKNKLTPGDTTLSMMKNFTGRAPDKKSVESIHKWCHGRYNRAKMDDTWQPVIVKNEPTFGMKIAGCVSRYSTSNKWFEVVDPRGFKLQISTSDLLALMSESTIVNGIIQEECVWGYSGSPFLAKVDGKRYNNMFAAQTKKESRVKVTASKLVIGDMYVNDSYYVYLGKAHIDMSTDKNTSYSSYHHKVATKLPHLTEVRDYFVFARIYEYEVNKELDKDTLSLKITKTCPKLYETDRVSVSPIADFISAIDKKKLSNYSLPTLKIPKELRGYPFSTKATKLVMPDLGIDKTY